MQRSWRVPAIGLFIFLGVILPAVVTFYTDWLWFGEMGYQAVFVKMLTTQGTLGGGAALAAFGFLLVNMRVAMRTVSPRKLVINTREGPIAVAVDRRRVQPVGTVVAAFLALLFGLFASSQWQGGVLFLHAQTFREVGPVLGKDV